MGRASGCRHVGCRRAGRDRGRAKGRGGLWPDEKDSRPSGETARRFERAWVTHWSNFGNFLSVARCDAVDFLFHSAAPHPLVGHGLTAALVKAQGRWGTAIAGQTGALPQHLQARDHT